ALEPLLGARQVLARGAGRFERGAGVAVGVGQRVFGLLQAIGAFAPGALRLGDLGDHAFAFFGEHLRRVFELGAVALGLGDALLERGDLGAGAVAAFVPAGFVAGQCRESLVGQFRLTHDRLLLGAYLGELGAFSGDVVAHGGELGFDIGGGRQRGQCALGLGLGGACLV